MLRELPQRAKRFRAAVFALSAMTVMTSGLLHATSAMAHDGEVCRKSYVSEYCTATMFVALGEAQHTGKLARHDTLQQKWSAFAAAYKAVALFDEETRHLVWKHSFHSYSRGSVRGCTGDDPRELEAIVLKSIRFCTARNDH